MATRGTAILIDNECVSVGPEFNGDMYPHGYGDNFLQDLSQVEDITGFIKFNNRFNKYNFGYQGIMKKYQGKFNNAELKNNGYYDMNIITQKNGPWVTSDWIFIKNITNKQQKIKDLNGEIINIRKNETIRFYFGKLIEDGYAHRIK